MDLSTLTPALAVWGAVTGILGIIVGVASLALRFKQHQKDQPQLVCTSDFSFEHSSGDVRPLNTVTIRSVGRRPVTINHIRYFIRPLKLRHNLLRWWYWSQNRWIYDQKPQRELQLSEGKKETIPIRLPDNLPLSSLLKAAIHDQAGNKWNIQWPRSSVIARLTHYEPLHASEERNDRRSCKVIAYRASGEFHIFGQWNITPGNHNHLQGRFFRFTSERRYAAKLKDICETQRPRLLLSENEGLS